MQSAVVPLIDAPVEPRSGSGPSNGLAHIDNERSDEESRNHLQATITARVERDELGLACWRSPSRVRHVRLPSIPCRYIKLMNDVCGNVEAQHKGA